MDTDYWIHQYRAHTDKIGERKIDSIMSVELKTFERDMPFAQRDTLRLVSAIHRETCCFKTGRTRTFRLDMGSDIRIARMYGYFVLRLEGDEPGGGWIEWNGRQIDQDTLVDVLRFRIDPRTLRWRRPNERRSHLPSARQRQPDLFVVTGGAA